MIETRRMNWWNCHSFAAFIIETEYIVAYKSIKEQIVGEFMFLWFFLYGEFYVWRTIRNPLEALTTAIVTIESVVQGKEIQLKSCMNVGRSLRLFKTVEFLKREI